MTWQSAIELEHEVAKYHAQQVLNGIGFDTHAARGLADRIEKELDEVTEEILETVPWQEKLKSRKPEPTPFRKSDGKVKENAVKWVGSNTILGPFTRVEFYKINLNSHEQIKSYLLSVGWIPIEYTEPSKRHPEGSPKLTEESFKSLPDNSIGHLIGKRNTLSHRLKLLSYYSEKAGKMKGWLHCIREDGRIEADAITIGTPTTRYTHINVVNVPKADKDILYGKEIRSLFIAGKGYILCGTDANSLEATVEAHYTIHRKGGKEYAKMLIEGDSKHGTDLHTRNAKIWDCSRPLAKNGKYALTYGCSAQKLAKTLHKKKSMGKKLYDAFWEGNTALKILSDQVKKAAKKGYLKGIDGRPIFVRSEHSALNALFQSTGSIIVKTATVMMNERFIESGLDYKQVGHFHDEVIFEVKEEDKEIVEDIIKRSWMDAGKKLGIKVDITGDVEFGKSWADVH